MINLILPNIMLKRNGRQMWNIGHLKTPWQIRPKLDIIRTKSRYFETPSNTHLDL